MVDEQQPIFVVQHHLATADHYDLRLEVDGVLVSWAVPKGPTLDPSRHRLAIRTGDHDLAHADYEGASERSVVQVWDRGTYRNTSHDKHNRPVPPAAALERGHLSVWLEGVKLRGGFTLIRTRQDDRSWLLVKKRDETAESGYEPTEHETNSVLSGRTIEDIAAG